MGPRCASCYRDPRRCSAALASLAAAARGRRRPRRVRSSRRATPAGAHGRRSAATMRAAQDATTLQMRFSRPVPARSTSLAPRGSGCRPRRLESGSRARARPLALRLHEARRGAAGRPAYRVPVRFRWQDADGDVLAQRPAPAARLQRARPARGPAPIRIDVRPGDGPRHAHATWSASPTAGTPRRPSPSSSLRGRRAGPAGPAGARLAPGAPGRGDASRGRRARPGRSAGRGRRRDGARRRGATRPMTSSRMPCPRAVGRAPYTC